MRIAVKPNPGEPRRVVDEVERVCLERGISDKIIFGFQLSLDELLTNVISYGFEGVTDHPVITVDIRVGDAEVEVTIRDNGRPFNPLREAETPDISLAAEDRPIGGLGIHLTKSFIDTLAYERIEGFNCLTLSSRWGLPESRNRHMNIETSYSGDTAVGVVSGRVDSSNAADFDGELSGIIDGGATNVVLDCGGLRYISSAGLRALLIAIRKTNQTGGGLALCQVPENILEVLEVSGFVRLTKVFDTVEEARASFK